MDKVIEILVADDHSLIRKGVVQILGEEPSFSVSEAKNGKEALYKIRNTKPQIALLDIEMPELNGFDIVKSVHNEGLFIDIIFLTMHKNEDVFNKAMDIGVKGYVLKENTPEEIIQCIKTVLNGKHYLSPAISEFLIRRNSNLTKEASDQDGAHLLTPAEKKILKKLSQLKTNQEIADETNISIKTVQNHRTNICGKLGISGTHALLKFAIERSDSI